MADSSDAQIDEGAGHLKDLRHHLGSRTANILAEAVEVHEIGLLTHAALPQLRAACNDTLLPTTNPS